jgi:hypothetical protein
VGDTPRIKGISTYIVYRITCLMVCSVEDMVKYACEKNIIPRNGISLLSHHVRPGCSAHVDDVMKVLVHLLDMLKNIIIHDRTRNTLLYRNT